MSVAITVVVLWFTGSLLVAYTLTRRNKTAYPEPLPDIPWAQFSEHRIHTADGEVIGAWLDETPGRTGPIVLISHGNGGSRTATLHVAELVAQAGYRSMLITHRAHGDSTGEINDFGYSASEDVIAAVRVIRDHDPQAPIIVWGRSLGSAAAIFAASRLAEDVSGMILECPYKDLSTAIWHRTENALPPVASHTAYVSMRIVSPLILPHIHKISPQLGAASIPPEMPVLVLCGGKDLRARPFEASAVHQAIGDNSQFILIPEGDHLQLHQADDPTYRQAVFDFLGRIAGRTASS